MTLPNTDFVPASPFVGAKPAVSPVTCGQRDPFGFESVHLLGIGGCGMSAIAQAMLACGLRVSGSDARASKVCEALVEAGATVYTGHDAANLGDVDAVVVSSAIRQDNAELAAARERGIRILHRSEALALFLASRRSVLVSGTHGKTTTSSLAALVLEAAGFDPWAFIGGRVPAFNGNTRIGGLEWAVAEADESDGSFEVLPAGHLIVTNIECDHLDYWKSRDAMMAGYCRVVAKAADDATILVNADDAGSRELLEAVTRKVKTYGIETTKADYYGTDIVLSARSASFDFYADSWFAGRFEIGAPGLHNVSNAIAALGMLASLGGDPSLAAEALRNFTGAGRRFDVKGEAAGVTVIDDYAHHPTEIRATIAAAHALKVERAGRLVTVFQPHRYTRTRDFLTDFAAAFDEADKVIFTDVYSAGEEPLPGVTIDALADLAAARCNHPVEVIRQRKDIVPLLLPHLREGDVVLMLGAGDITHSAQELLDSLSSQSRSQRGPAT
ncbi:MAG: UDP-N-acetylmuramate--alanine ligase [Candidatus Sumerlaeota bacterium]|nr:UDP-N-acetylmuramate--alanine ligase [Candidatus Sumerlaeota bacterium]